MVIMKSLIFYCNLLFSSEVGALTAGEGSTLADLVALNIGQIGENMVIGDATVIHSEKGRTSLQCF